MKWVAYEERAQTAARQLAKEPLEGGYHEASKDLIHLPIGQACQPAETANDNKMTTPPRKKKRGRPRKSETAKKSSPSVKKKGRPHKKKPFVFDPFCKKSKKSQACKKVPQVIIKMEVPDFSFIDKPCHLLPGLTTTRGTHHKEAAQLITRCVWGEGGGG